MDKKLNNDLENFFYGDSDTWDKICIDATRRNVRKKGEITSCCSSHALEQFITFYFPKLNIPIDIDVRKMTEPQIKAIKPGLDTNVLNAITKWRCSDAEHNDYIDWIRALAKQEMK